jgi:hypothetical protein
MSELHYQDSITARWIEKGISRLVMAHNLEHREREPACPRARRTTGTDVSCPCSPIRTIGRVGSDEALTEPSLRSEQPVMRITKRKWESGRRRAEHTIVTWERTKHSQNAVAIVARRASARHPHEVMAEQGNRASCRNDSVAAKE